MSDTACPPVVPHGTRYVLKVLRELDPIAFVSTNQLVGWMLKEKLHFAALVLSKHVKSPEDYPKFRSPVLAFDCDHADGLQCLADDVADLTPDWVDSDVYDPDTMAICHVVGDLQFNAVVEEVVMMEEVNWADKIVAIKAAQINIPKYKDEDKFNEEIDGLVTFYSVTVSCAVNESRSKKQKCS